MKKSKISSKNQIVIPALVRERLNLRKGTSVSIYAINDDEAIISKKLKSHARSMLGLGKEIWDKLGGADKYLKGERDSWDK